jgi:hypothetical protein
MMDATGGAYLFHQDMPFLSEAAWIFEPYRIIRKNGGLQRRDASEFKAVIADVGMRIESYLTGNCGRSIFDIDYTTLKSGKGWVMICDAGSHARTALLSYGTTAFVEVRPRKTLDGVWDYTIGKMTPISSFPVSEILNALNTKEKLQESPDRWGGSDMIGGSPRSSGSKLDPDEVFQIVENTIIGK